MLSTADEKKQDAIISEIQELGEEYDYANTVVNLLFTVWKTNFLPLALAQAGNGIWDSATIADTNC